MEKLRRWLARLDLVGAEAMGGGRLLHTILLILLVGTASFEIFLFRLAFENHITQWIVLAALGIEAAAFLLLRSGRMRLAAFVLSISLWAILMLVIYLGDSIAGVSALGQVLIIVMAGLVIGEPFAALLTLLTIAGNYGAMLIQTDRALPFGQFRLSLPAHWAFQSVYFLITLGLLLAFNRGLRIIFAEAQSNEQALKDRVNELRQAQAQLEISDQNLRRREAILESVRIAAEKLFRGRSFGGSVQQVLRDLGQATGVDRVHIFENHRDPMGDLLASERYEWMAEGIDPQIRDPQYQSMSYAKSRLGRWAELLADNQVIKAHVKDLPEPERTRLKPQGILSLLVVPIFIGDEWWGFMGFDETKWEREWSPAEEDALRGAAGILGGAIERRRSERALNQSEARYLAILQDQFDMICRYTPDGRVTFANEAYYKYFGGSPEDMQNHVIWAHVLNQDVEGLRAKLDSLTPKQPTAISQNLNRRSDGQMRWQEWTDRGIFDENGQLIEIQAVGRDIDDEMRLRKQLEENLQKMETQAMTDPLTGLLNRRAIMEHAEAEWQRAQREGRPLSLVVMDVDRLKEINDTFGHLAGDQALNQLAGLLRNSMRRYDWVGRWGGDEFMLVLPGTDLEEARNVADRLRLRFKQSKISLKKDKEIELHVSMGVACRAEVGKDEDTLQNLIARADRALYQAKQNGRDQVGG